jgi:hypothetical protein
MIEAAGSSETLELSIVTSHILILSGNSLVLHLHLSSKLFAGIQVNREEKANAMFSFRFLSFKQYIFYILPSPVKH